jgi:hypothetical protein
LLRHVRHPPLFGHLRSPGTWTDMVAWLMPSWKSHLVHVSWRQKRIHGPPRIHSIPWHYINDMHVYIYTHIYIYIYADMHVQITYLPSVAWRLHGPFVQVFRQRRQLAVAKHEGPSIVLQGSVSCRSVGTIEGW